MERGASARRRCQGALGLRSDRWPNTERMKKISYAGYWFPPEIIHQAIWLYLPFALQFSRRKVGCVP